MWLDDRCGWIRVRYCPSPELSPPENSLSGTHSRPTRDCVGDEGEQGAAGCSEDRRPAEDTHDNIGQDGREVAGDAHAFLVRASQEVRGG